MRDCAHQRAPWQGTSAGRSLIWRGHIGISPLLESYSCPGSRLNCCGTADGWRERYHGELEKSRSAGWLPVALESTIPAGNCGAGAECIFLAECPEEVVQAWLRESKSQYESARAGLSVLWPFGIAEGVLSALDGLPETGRKALCISGKLDLLVTTEMVSANADAYRAADNGDSVITEAVIGTSGHHLMLDVGREECAEVIMYWLKGLIV